MKKNYLTLTLSFISVISFIVFLVYIVNVFDYLGVLIAPAPDEEYYWSLQRLITSIPMSVLTGVTGILSIKKVASISKDDEAAKAIVEEEKESE